MIDVSNFEVNLRCIKSPLVRLVLFLIGNLFKAISAIQDKMPYHFCRVQILQSFYCQNEDLLKKIIGCLKLISWIVSYFFISKRNEFFVYNLHSFICILIVNIHLAVFFALEIFWISAFGCCQKSCQPALFFIHLLNLLYEILLFYVCILLYKH